MATDNTLGKKIDKDYDPSKIPGVSFTPSTMLGIVKDNLSPARDGRIRVWIPDFGTVESDSNGWKKVSYASPYFGATYQPTKDQNNHFTSVRHTYGMWMTPPDVGSQVLCAFVNGDPNRGYWFACINPTASGYMVPAIGASSDLDTTFVSDAIKASVLPLDGPEKQYLPVAEFNVNDPNNINGTIYANKKPIHEIQANILFMQGLDRDKSRGAISSTSVRETPSNVFGISTPGRPLTKDPADDPSFGSKVASGDIPDDQYQIPSRKGGHTFVMDDGDIKGVDQLIRLRTASGHQILMNDDQSFIYINHKNGTSWVEIDDTGIKIYTKGDFSVRSEGNMNFHADGDINMQSLGSIKMDSSTATTITSPQINIGGAEKTLIYGGKMSMGGGQIIVSSDGKLSMSSAAAMTINGSTIDINGGVGGSSIPNPVASKGKFADATYDSTVTRLWTSVPNSIDSVVSVLPTHEPWTRAQAPVPLIKETASSVCAPKTGGAVTSSSGTVTDGSGKPIGTSSSANVNTDLGIVQAAGLSVVGNTCPAEYLKKTTTFNPTSGIGSAAPKFAQQQVKSLLAELGYYESQFDYGLVNDSGARIGKYQVDAAYLVSAGYIKPDALKQYGTNTLAKSESWTGKDDIQSQDDFFSSQNVQDTIQFNEFNTNYTALLSNGGIKTSDDICTAAGMLFVAHQFRDVNKALQWRQQGTLTDEFGRPGSDYYNQGRYAIDVLAAGGVVATPTPTSASGPGGTNASGVDPDDVFAFTGTGSGTRANFDQLNGEFKTALCNMAHAYKLAKGGKITITSAYRSPADQDAIYQKWLAAGGGPNRPTAGGITTPAKPLSQGGKGSPHNSGVAIDSSQCPLIARTVNLAQYGLRWGGTFTKPDAVHIQMANAS